MEVLIYPLIPLLAIMLIWCMGPFWGAATIIVGSAMAFNEYQNKRDEKARESKERDGKIQ